MRKETECHSCERAQRDLVNLYATRLTMTRSRRVRRRDRRTGFVARPCCKVLVDRICGLIQSI
jgi:hypothetical protein